jgi:hypothetical protein
MNQIYSAASTAIRLTPKYIASCFLVHQATSFDGIIFWENPYEEIPLGTAN